jgi:hypothetical protein
MPKLLIPILVAAALALAVVAPASADAPTKVTTHATFGPFVDDETCAFPITTTVDRTRTTLTFANGDVKRHVDLIVTISANGKTWIGRDSYDIFIDHSSANLWIITGAFTHTQVDGGGIIFLESGRIPYDAATDEIIDTNPGPHGTGADSDVYAAMVCANLAP